MTREDVKSWVHEAFMTKSAELINFKAVQEVLDKRPYPDYDLMFLFGLEDGDWQVVSKTTEGKPKREIAFVKDEQVVLVPTDTIF